MLAALLTIAALGQGQPKPSMSVDSAEALVRRMQTAVEAGRGDDERSRWNARWSADSTDVRALLALATLDRLMYRTAEAERSYQLLVRSGRADGAPSAYGVLGLGMLRAQEARLAEAEPLLRRAVRTLGRTGHSAGEAQALGTLGIVVSRTVSLDSAIALHAAALRAVPPGDDWLRGLTECNALVARVRKADPEVERLARLTADAAKRAGNPRAAAACLAALAQDYERRTLIDSALATFGEVAELQRATRNLSALAVTRQWQGFVLFSLKDDFSGAYAALTEALSLGKQTGSVAASAWASLDLAELALTVGDLSSAGVYARTATAMFTNTGDRWGLLQSRTHEGDVALLNRAPAAARSAYEQVLRDAGAVFPTEEVHARARLAFVGLLEGDMVEASRAIDEAWRLSRTLRMSEWRQEDAYARAMIALAAGRFGDSEAYLRALDRMLPAAALPAHADVLTRLAEVHARLGDVQKAEAELTEAGTLIDRWRLTLSQRELQAAVVQAHRLDWDRDLGFASVVHEIAQRGRVAAAFRLSEQRRARVLLEHMTQRRALATRSANDASAASVPPAVLSDSAVRRVLPDSTAVLVFLTGRGGEPTTVFVLTRDRLAAAAADPVDDHLLELDRFAGLVAGGDDPAELSVRLGDAFLRTALSFVPPGVRRLVIVPDGPLHRIPFDALRTSAGPRAMLLDRFAVSLAPSASVAAAWWVSPPRAPLPRLLAFGDPADIRLPADAGDSIPPRLPAAATEVRQIGRYSALAEVFTGRDAREARLRHSTLADVGILHFATHALVDDWSLLRSALFLSPGDGEDGRVSVDELVGMHVNANLVVLAACRSGGGAVLSGEGLQGLTAPFLESGAASVVATLWQIGDRSAAPFVELFYRELTSGASVGDALHRAKLAARAQGMSPGVWSAFTLTGDGRVHTALRPPGTELRASILSILVVASVAGYLVSRTISRRNSDRR